MTTDERLLSHLDGTLSPDERTRLEEDLRAQPDLRRRFEELQEIDQMLKAVTLEKTSEMFTARVMGKLDHAPARRPLWQGLALLAGILVIVTVAAMLVSQGMFNDKSTLDFSRLGIDNDYVSNLLPTISFQGTWLVNIIIVANLVLAFLILDRLILKQWYKRQMDT